MSLSAEGVARREVHARLTAQQAVLVYIEQFMRGDTNEGDNFYLIEVWRFPLSEHDWDYRQGARFEYNFTCYKRVAWISEQGGGAFACTFCWREVPSSERWQRERYPKFLLQRGEEVTLQMKTQGRVSVAVTGDMFAQV